MHEDGAIPTPSHPTLRKFFGAVACLFHIFRQEPVHVAIFLKETVSPFQKESRQSALLHQMQKAVCKRGVVHARGRTRVGHCPERMVLVQLLHVEPNAKNKTQAPKIMH